MVKKANKSITFEGFVFIFHMVSLTANIFDKYY